jgi:hypothetical protein
MTSKCSFCTKDASAVKVLVAGAGVFICDECIALAAQVAASRRTSGPGPRIPPWEQIDDAALLEHLPRIEAVRDQVDDDLREWVGEARRREISWDRIGAALGMRRQSAWERFAGDRG